MTSQKCVYPKKCTYCGHDIEPGHATVQFRAWAEDPSQPRFNEDGFLVFLHAPNPSDIAVQRAGKCVEGYRTWADHFKVKLIPVNPGDRYWEG